MVRTPGHCFSIVLTTLLASASPVRAQSVAITGATIIDGTGKAPVTDGVVLISGDRIAAVGRAREVAVPKAARRFDAQGKYVIPGLMDANVHLVCNIDLETLIKYEDRLHEIALEAAQIALKAGQTTVFDTWGPRAALVKARNMINAGKVPGSRIYLAGNIIGFDGPLTVEFDGEINSGSKAAEQVSKAFANRINETWEQGIGRKLLRMTPEEVRSVMRDYVRRDVDFLKYAAVGHGRGWSDFITFSPRVQRVIVEEAHRAGLTVQVHNGGEATEMAIEAGVDILTHGIGVKQAALIPKLVERGIAVSVRATTRRWKQALENHPVEWFRRRPNPQQDAAEAAHLRNMIKAGVTVMLITDAWIQDPVMLAEQPVYAAERVEPIWKLGEAHFNGLLGLEEQGVEPMDILKMATSNIAKGYKLEAKLGTLEPGKIADLVILDANPLESARNYRRIHAVLKDGKLVDRNALPVAPIISTRSTTKATS